MRLFLMTLVAVISLLIVGCNDDDNATNPIPNNSDKAIAVVKALETGNVDDWKNYVSEDTYIQHNLSFPDGRQVVIDAISTGNLDGTTVSPKRVFETENFVVLHSEYFLFGKSQVGFDVFRFEDGKIVEHWDNLQDLVEETVSGRTQIDGPTEITDIDKTTQNRNLVENFVNDILMGANPDSITDYISTEQYDQHNPSVGDGLEGLGTALQYFAENNLLMQYDVLHKVIAKGNFVLTMSEGLFGTGDHVAYYDLFRVENGKIVEHWDAIEIIPNETEWANPNGKF